MDYIINVFIYIVHLSLRIQIYEIYKFEYKLQQFLMNIYIYLLWLGIKFVISEEFIETKLNDWNVKINYFIIYLKFKKKKKILICLLYW